MASKNGPFADRLFRIAFALAGGYNLAFGLWAAVWPLSFFEWFQVEPPRYPAVWAGLVMVVSAVVNSAACMVFATVTLFPLIVAWSGWLGVVWKRVP